MRACCACAPLRLCRAAIRYMHRTAGCPVPTDDGLQDRALLLVGFADALRCSELALIRVDQLERTERGLRHTAMCRPTSHWAGAEHSNYVGINQAASHPRIARPTSP
jgi:hypothetical protein